jgi:hypothetical protein
MIPGKIRLKGSIIFKEEHPHMYWALIGICIGAGILLLISYFVFGIVYHRW